MNLAPRGPSRFSSSSSRSDAHAVAVQRDAPDLGLVCREGLERAHVRGTFCDDDVARVQKRLREQIQPLLGAGGHDDVIGAHAHARLGHQLDDERASLGAPVARAVLQRCGALVQDRVVSRLGDRLRRDATHFGHAAGERDHVRAAGRGEQVAYGARAHAREPLRVAVGPPVEDNTCGTHSVHLPSARAFAPKNNKPPRPDRARGYRGTTYLRSSGVVSAFAEPHSPRYRSGTDPLPALISPWRGTSEGWLGGNAPSSLTSVVLAIQSRA